MCYQVKSETGSRRLDAARGNFELLKADGVVAPRTPGIALNRFCRLL